jgi:hypothetical protein
MTLILDARRFLMHLIVLRYEQESKGPLLALRVLSGLPGSQY